MRKTFFSLLKFSIGWPISLVAIFFIIKTFLPQYQVILDNLRTPNTFLLLLSAICFNLFFFLRSFLWKKLLQEKGYNIPLKEVSFLWGTSELKRFVPGNIWSFLGKGATFFEKGVEKKVITKLLLVEAEVFVIGCLLVSLFSLPFILNNNLIGILTLITTVFVLSLFLIFGGRINKLRTLLPDYQVDINLKILFISALSLMFFGLGTFFSVSSITYLNAKLILQLTGFFVLSLFIGYISFLTPMGLGVREAVIIWGLSKVISVQIAGLTAIYTRILLVLSEMFFLIISFTWKNLRNKFFLKIENAISANSYNVYLTILIIIYILYFTVASFQRYDNFYTGRFDLGNMDQTVWNTIHGRFFELTDPNGTNNISRLAFHADFILVLISPLYLIWSNPKMLLLFQSTILGFGAIFVYLLSKNILKNKNISLAFSFAYLINPLIGFANLYDFHPVTLSITFLLGTFYFLKQKKYFLFLLFLVLSALTKEQIWIIGAIFGLYVFFIEKKKLLGIVTTIVCFAIFYSLVWYAIPQAIGGKHFALSYYSDFGDSPTAIIKNIIISPQKTLAAILQQKQISYLFNIFLPLGFLPILNPLTLTFALPELLINLLSKNSNLQEIYYHYASSIIPFLFISAIYAVSSLKRWIPKVGIKIYAYYVVIISILSVFVLGPLPFSLKPNVDMFTNPQPEKEIIENFLSSIPRKFSIAATNNVGSHLSHRQKIFTIPVGIDQADIIVFLLNDSFAQPSLEAQKEMAKKMENDKNYIEIFRKGEFIVFEKRNLYLENGQKKIRQVKLFPLSIPTLADRNYEGGTVNIEKQVGTSKLFTTYIVSYLSDGLKIYSLMNVPKTPKPENGYPVVIINHGYIDPKNYDAISSYKTVTDYFSSQGFLVLKPDYRGNGKSEIDNRALMRFAYPIDVMNLISSVKNIDGADFGKIYLWGHSMGGEVTLKALEIIGKKPELSKRVKAAALWAPVTDPIRWFTKSHLPRIQEYSSRPFPYTETFKILGTPDENPGLWQSLSPLFYLSYIQTPVQINQGTSDETVPYEWSVELFNDLKSLNKKTESHLYLNDNHNLAFSQEKALKNTLNFFMNN